MISKQNCSDPLNPKTTFLQDENYHCFEANHVRTATCCKEGYFYEVPKRVTVSFFQSGQSFVPIEKVHLIYERKYR